TNYELRIKNLRIRLISQENRLITQIKKIVEEDHINNIAFEAENLKYIEYKYFKKALTFSKLRPTTNFIPASRQVKEEHEIKMMRMAARYTDECMKEIIKFIKIGVSERELAFKIEYLLKEKGLELAFAPIVAIDKNSAAIHYAPGDTKVKNGSIILIDLGAKYNNYCSDITRMVFVGKPKSEYVNAYQTLLQTQTDSIKLISKTKNWKDVDIHCRKLLKENNFPEFLHSLGHGVGLEVHENPHISFMSKDKIAPGQVITIEPGIYVPGKFGMRIEDTIYINEKKETNILTQYSKKLLVI
ncbi:MAG TPA: M24 family metallopeptidase, partial [Candidatus Nitrosocosmicus sp.]|nr:M24 family metallopeptidase [Candidatus Nitrosocosmicus sp.]